MIVGGLDGEHVIKRGAGDNGDTEYGDTEDGDAEGASRREALGVWRWRRWRGLWSVVSFRAYNL